MTYLVLLIIFRDIIYYNGDMMLRVIDNKFLLNNEIDRMIIESGDRLVVDKDLMTKPKNLNFRFMFFNRLSSLGLYVTRLFEISVKDEYMTFDEENHKIKPVISFYDTIHAELGNRSLPKYAILIEINSEAKIEVEYFSEFRSGDQKRRVLKSSDNNYVQLTTDIIGSGIDYVYAKSSIPDGFVPLKKNCTADAGKVLSLFEKDSQSEELESLPYISPATMKYPVITDKCNLSEIKDSRPTVLQKGAILLLAQARQDSDLFKPVLVPHGMRAYISNKLYYINLLDEDIEYSELLCEYFNTTDTLQKQFPRSKFSVPINQFRSIFIPTKEYLKQELNMPADKYTRLERLTENLVKATLAVAEAEAEISKLQNRVYKKEILE